MPERKILMDIKNLRYFLAVAREENMSHAAKLLHVTQPTLSKALKGLEEELGKKLFIRKSFSIKLTEEGMLLRDRAADLVQMADKIESEFSALDDITGGELSFGLAESYQIRYLAKELAKLKKKYPNFTYHITSGDTEQVSERLEKGLLDFAVICETPDINKFNYLPFPGTDLWGAIMRKDHKLANKKHVTVKDLIGQPLFCSDQSWANEIPSWAKENFSHLHLEGSFRLSYNGSMFAADGLGILLAFEKLIDCSEESDLTFIPLSPKCETKFHLIWNKYQSFTPIANKFLEQVSLSFKK